jgi:AP-3 complex subunit sigma
MSKEREEEALRERKSNGKRKLVGGDDDTRVIYRHYATLYFVYVLFLFGNAGADGRFVVDGAESELGILDLIQVCRVHAARPQYADSQVFVESLDRAFENVCELDLIFHFDEVSLATHVLECKADV